MKLTKKTWLMGVVLLAGLPVLAVNPDNVVPCWRDTVGSTRQVWTFDTGIRTNQPAAADLKVNQAGSPVATMILGSLGQGWTSNNCARLGNGCGPVVTAVLPLGDGPPYAANEAVAGPPYTDPPPYGSAQGYIDLGPPGNEMTFTVPNGGAPAGTVRYFYIQGTYMQNPGVASPPNYVGVTNSAGLGTTNRVGSAVTVDVEQPLNLAGNLQPAKWQNRRLTIMVGADPAAGNDVVTIRGTAAAWWTDAVVVETLDRVAVGDALSAAKDTATNIPFSQLLANDRGGDLISVGSAVNCTVVTNAPGVVTFTPTPGFSGTASFWYTNRDCAGLTNLGAQVSVTVVGNVAPVATDKSFNRGSGVAMRVTIASLLSGDSDSDGGTVHFDGTSATTTNGAALSHDATYVYVPARTVNDAFTYTIDDGQGGTNTANVYLPVVSSSGQAGGVSVTGNSATAVFYGVPGVSYHVQRATDAQFTVGVKSFVSAEAPGDGVITVVDDFSDLEGVPGSAFYRLLTP